MRNCSDEKIDQLISLNLFFLSNYFYQNEKKTDKDISEEKSNGRILHILHIASKPRYQESCNNSDR